MRLFQLFIIAVASAIASAGTLPERQCVVAGACDGGSAGRACCDGGTTDGLVCKTLFTTRRPIRFPREPWILLEAKLILDV